MQVILDSSCRPPGFSPYMGREERRVQGLEQRAFGYYTRVRAQIINHMNSSLASYLINCQMARNKVRVKGIEIIRAAPLLSTDIFVYTQFGDTYKWKLENL